MKRQSAFRSRLFFSYSALIVLSVLVFLVALGWVIVRTGESESRAAQKETLVSGLRQLESSVRELDTLASQTMSNAQLISYFVPLMSDDDDENYFSSNVLEFIDASSLLATLNSTSNTAARISVYNLGGDYVSTGTLYETPERITQTLSDKEHIKQQMQLLSAGERRIILPPAPDPYSASQSRRLFSILRPLSSAYVSQIYGIVAVQQDVSMLEQLGLFYDTPEGACLLVDADGERILPLKAGPLSVSALAGARDLPIESAGEVSSADHASELDTLFVSAATMDMSGWRMIIAQPTSRLSQAYRGTIWMMVLAGLALMVVLLLVTYLMADRMSSPLRQLSDTIGQVTLSNLALEAPTAAPEHATAELMQLDSAFRTMLGRLNDSIGLEMRAYMYALQSQMNPHFLYNTLSVICTVGQEESAPKTVDMLMKLSGMLRYVADSSTDSVTLKDEVDHAERYLQLMKVRYEDKFGYQIHMDPGAESVRVPRLILQPLCENCFQHGFKGRPPWSIRITVQLQGDRFMLTVADNGAGIDDDQIAQLKQRIDDSLRDLAGNYPELKLGGMGLVNTVLRLNLMQGGSISYSILRSPEGGTMIQIGGRST
ncbi:histidine kinase [Eubacteriales bacterium OttesenSCG-928-N13]|nr:histidine kinase [Eubacteriales bacterium OttesenSCG-928-N13]